MATFTAAGLDRLDAALAASVAEGQVPGVVAGVACGDEVHVCVAGAATIGGPPMAEDTIMRLASVTKPMVAATALAQVADGLIGLDDAIDPWLPELADRRVLISPDGPLADTVPAERPVTLRDLLTSTWGIGMHGALFSPQPWPIQAASDERSLSLFGLPEPSKLPDVDTWLARLGELPLLAQPGANWLYQTSSSVLGALVARLERRPLDDVMRTRLFEPLGMTDTGFGTNAVDRLATLYVRGNGDAGEGGELAVFDPPAGQWAATPAFPDGSGGLVGTAGDVIAFGRMLLRDGAGVIPSELAAEMTRDQLTDTQRDPGWDGYSFLGDRGWGYGVSVLADRYQWEGGFGTVWCNVPDADLTVVVLSQRLWDETGPPAIIEDAITAAIAAVA